MFGASICPQSATPGTTAAPLNLKALAGRIRANKVRPAFAVAGPRIRSWSRTLQIAPVAARDEPTLLSLKFISPSLPSSGVSVEERVDRNRSESESDLYRHRTKIDVGV